MKRLVLAFAATLALGGCAGTPQSDKPSQAPPQVADVARADTFPRPMILQPSPERQPNLAIEHALQYPTRVANGPGDKLYVSDVKVGSVFVLSSTLALLAELKNLGRPLGVAVDGTGRIFVGSHARKRVEVYNPNGSLIRIIGDGAIEMPNALALDEDENLYVVDSVSAVVRMFGPDGELLRTIGGDGHADGQFKFPAAVAVAPRLHGRHAGKWEVFVADQGNARIQVFDRQGSFLRKFGQPAEAFGVEWRGRFVRPQGLSVDRNGYLHVLDTGLTKVQVMDHVTGEYVADYGTLGRNAGQLYLPLDLITLASGEVLLTDAGNRRLSTLTSPTVGLQGGQ